MNQSTQAPTTALVQNASYLLMMVPNCLRSPKKKVSGKPKNPEVEKIILEFKPEKAIEKIKKIKKIEIETSTKLTNLTSRNMDVSSSEVLRKFKAAHLSLLRTDRSHGQQFQKDFDEATRCLEEYIKALEKEVSERTELISMLEDAKVYYDSQNGEARIVASAYKNFGNRVKGLKKKLEVKTKTLPSPVPSPTPDAPSPTNSDDGLQLPAIQETGSAPATEEAPLTDNGAVIDSPCSAPSPGSAPSPEGSPVGLSPVVPETGDSGTTSNATGNAAALSSFMSQSPTVLSSWLDAFNQEFQENKASPTVVNTSALAAAIPAQSTLESRLSNLMQSMGHIPGGLFSSTSSASNTPKQADSPPYSSAVFRPAAAVSEVHSGNTPLKDENSGQGTPVLDENSARKAASLMDSDMRVHAIKPTTPQDSPDARISTAFGSRIPSLASPNAWMQVSPKAGSSNAAASQSTPALAPPPIPPALQAYLEPIKTVTGAAHRSVAAAPKGRSETPPSPSADYLIPVAENFDVTDMELDDDGSGDDEHAEGLHRKKLSNLITLVQPQVSPAAETTSPGPTRIERNEDSRPQLDTSAQPAVMTSSTSKLTPSLASQGDTRHMRNPSPDLIKQDLVLDFPAQDTPSEPHRRESTDFTTRESSEFSLLDSLDFDTRKSTIDFDTRKSTLDFDARKSTVDFDTRKSTLDFDARKSTVDFDTRKSTLDFDTRKSTLDFDSRKSTLDFDARKSTVDFDTRKSTVDFDSRKSTEFRLHESSDYTTRERSEFRVRESSSSSEFRVRESPSSEYRINEPPSSEFRIQDSSSEFRIQDSPSSSEFQVHDSFSSDFHATPAKIETVQMRSSLDRSPTAGPMEERGMWERGDYYSPRTPHHQPQQQQQQAMSNGGNRMRGRGSGYYGYEMRGRPVDRFHEGYGAYESEWRGGRPPSPRYRHYGGQARGAPYFQPRY
ncbi:regulation of nuclear pre-mRNA domain-containing protein 2-like isoform X3 [Dermacentor silvarum]|uniref:regulation of nuclear pre-mRNA domain-containing protein 2-like isoform X3 n=1 Tax=Dermacentor silvarum TaxID=543639 RepID=UPI002100DF07|nr:regulation of nuclear pre-mRNA domain-containing protein 2-like isoform X3 [Dermacentor silvarum]